MSIMNSPLLTELSLIVSYHLVDFCVGKNASNLQKSEKRAHKVRQSPHPTYAHVLTRKHVILLTIRTSIVSIHYQSLILTMQVFILARQARMEKFQLQAKIHKLIFCETTTDLFRCPAHPRHSISLVQT